MSETLIEAQPCIGLDYGVKPKVLLVGDLEFAGLLQNELLAIGYGRIPQYGLLVDVPAVTLLFSDIDSARQCSEKIRRWMEEAGSEDAVRISFVRLNDSEYALCISQDIACLEKRLLTADDAEVFQPLVYVHASMRKFPISSGGFEMMRESAGRSYVVFCFAAGNDVPPDLSFRKRNVLVYSVEEANSLPDILSPERSLLLQYLEDQSGNTGARPAEDEYVRDLPPPSPDNLYRHRETMLRRFFPVTFERTQLYERFRSTQATLVKQGYAPWQILQAACNITLRHNVPDIVFGLKDNSTDEQSGAVRIVEHLLETPERVMAAAYDEAWFGEDELRAQIEADARYLLEGLGVSHEQMTSGDVQQALAQERFLDTVTKQAAR